mgnify:CR=1 FL=1
MIFFVATNYYPEPISTTKILKRILHPDFNYSELSSSLTR